MSPKRSPWKSTVRIARRVRPRPLTAVALSLLAIPEMGYLSCTSDEVCVASVTATDESTRLSPMSGCATGRTRRAAALAARLVLPALLALLALAGATLVPTSGHKALYKPAAFCPANQACFSDAKWTVWTHRRAVARATETPSCPGVEPSECQSPAQKVRVVFTQPRHLCGGTRYTRAHWRPEPGVHLSETTFFDVGIGGAGGRGAVCIWSGG